ncbi:hypothetical protein [Flavobacterium flavigenum]|uniref:hypothetical protein n=1 Tax=Flavobacterium flavigenum TaxID=3003258 RepID=UPI0022AC05A1|nr:hypothetical protein [Flavobacterium flavigenum]
MQDLSNNDWKLWLDPMAQWQNDVLFTPSVDIKKLPVNLPTGGWQALQKLICDECYFQMKKLNGGSSNYNNRV